MANQVRNKEIQAEVKDIDQAQEHIPIVKLLRNNKLRNGVERRQEIAEKSLTLCQFNRNIYLDLVVKLPKKAKKRIIAVRG